MTEPPARIDAKDGVCLLLLAALCALFVALRLAAAAPPCEDAAILMRYSEHLAAGHGIVWNVGEGPVDGATDFLFMVVLAGVRWLGPSIGRSAQLIGVLSHVATAAVLYLGIRRLHGTPRWTGLLSAAYLLVGPGIAYVEAGFGTPFFGLFAATTWYLAYRMVRGAGTRGTDVLFALSSLALGLVRPEGVFLALFMLLAVVLHRGRARTRRTLLVFLLVFGIPGAAYFLWRWSYFGHPLPNPYYIKGRGHVFPRHLVNGAIDVVRLAAPFVPLFLYAVAASFVRFWVPAEPREEGGPSIGGPREVVFVLVPVVGFTVIGMLHEGLMDYVMRFQYCLLPVLLLSWPALLARALRDWGVRTPVDAQRRPLAIAAAAVATLVAVAYSWTTFEVRAPRRWGTLQVARILFGYPHDYAMAVTNAGQLPLFSGWRAVDVWGLNDHEIASTGLTEELLDRYRPQVIQFDANFTPLSPEPHGTLPWHKAMQLLRSYAHEHDYVLAACFGRSPFGGHYYYVRRDFPESAEVVRRIRELDYFLIGGRCYDFGVFDPSRRGAEGPG